MRRGLLGGGLYARWLAGLAVLGGGALQIVGVLFTTDSLQPLAWLSVAICIIKAERDDEPALVAGRRVDRRRRLSRQIHGRALSRLACSRACRDGGAPAARTLGAVGGALIALAIAAPNLIWQAANGWPFVAHTAVLAAQKNIPLSPVAFLCRRS